MQTTFIFNTMPRVFHIDNKKISVTNSYCYLGVDVSNTGSFKKATDTLYKKSLRALYSIYSSLNVKSDQPNVRIFLKLFDSLVQPILLYGSDLWGSHCLGGDNVVSKFVNKFYRTLLGVKRHCSNVGVLAELGRYPIDVNIAKAMLKYWIRVATLPTSRLASHCYWTLFEQPNVKDNWFDSIKTLINSTGQYFIWNNQVSFFRSNEINIKRNKNYILKTIQDLYVQFSHEKMSLEKKLYLFKNDVDPIAVSNYLLTTFGREKRATLSNLRLGTTDLELEIGRKSITPRESRFCKLCDLNKVEDELHFLFICPALETTRSPFIESLINSSIGFRNRSSFNKMMYLYFNNNIKPNNLNIAAEMLIQLKQARANILSRDRN